MGMQKKGIIITIFIYMLILSPYTKKVTNISIHMGTKKTKKLTITIFIPYKFIEVQSYHDIKGLVVCMFSDYAHIDHIDYNEMCACPLHQKEFLLSLVFLLGVLF